MKTTKSSMLPATLRTVGMVLITIMLTIVAHSHTKNGIATMPEIAMHVIMIIGIVALVAFVWAEVITTVSSIRGSFDQVRQAMRRLGKEVKNVGLDT